MRLEKINCCICGADNTVSLGVRHSPDGNPGLKTSVVRCVSCGLIYPDPMPILSDEEVQANFGDPAGYFPGHVDDRRLARFDATVRSLEKFLPGKGKIFDVGCGRGELVYAAKRRGWKAKGSEISAAFAREARDKFDVDVLEGDIRDMDIPQGEFDAVTLSSVIQYVSDPLGMLKKINTILKPGGLLYLEVTNEDALVFAAGDLFSSIVRRSKTTTRLSPLFPSFQIYGFNKNSLSKALKVCGFDVMYIRASGLSGGGSVKGAGGLNKVINHIRKVIIFTGGIVGMGHVIYCFARKEISV